ncbi:hypothetical protein [Citrobacter portucalensis]
MLVNKASPDEAVVDGDVRIPSGFGVLLRVLGGLPERLQRALLRRMVRS